MSVEAVSDLFSATTLDRDLAALDAGERLAAFRAAVPGRIVFTTSFGIEDQAITDLIVTRGLDIDIVTLDTGRLFPETYRVWADTEAKYARRIRAYYPDAAALEALIVDQGIDGFYYGIEMRKACCHARKVAPLARALSGATGWITGLRADQSTNRAMARLVEADPTRRLLKLNPLIDWSRDDAVAHTTRHAVPVNALHADGYLSIGCAPCTRALKPGEPERAGRWWWEDEAKKECGLHIAADGRRVRASHP